MKNTTTYIIPLLVLIVFLNGVLLYFSFSDINSKNAIQYNNEKNQDAIVENFYLENNLFESFINSSHSIDDFLDRLKSENIYTVDPAETVLVCHYSSMSCNPCVDFVMNKLKEHFPVDKKNRFLLFASNYKKGQDLGFDNAINIGKTKLGISIEDSNIPILYVMKDSKIEHVFMPDPNYPKYLDKYFKIIKQRYYNE